MGHGHYGRKRLTQRSFGKPRQIKNSEKSLKDALEKEHQLNELKSRFVSMASHEFRTPLSTILSSMALVEHYTEPEQAAKRMKHIDRIKSSVKNLTNILDDFLSLEKLEQGHVDVRSTEFDLKEFLTDVTDEIDGLLKRKFQTLHLHIEGDTSLCQDKKILRNVLLNLLSNAIKYSPEEKQIWVRAEVTGEDAMLTVRDEGMGIPAEAQPHLFSKFYRAGNAVNIQGTGLGLHIVKRYMELMDGNIRFESKEGKGTTFILEFPKTITS